METNKNYGLGGIISVILIILLVVMGYICIHTGIECFDSNENAFDWLDDSTHALGTILHIIMPAIPVGGCVNGIFRLLKKSHMKSSAVGCAVLLFVWGCLFYIGQKIWNDYSYNSDLSIVLYRIFGTYRQLVKPLFIIAAIIFVLSLLIKDDKENIVVG